MYETYNTYNDLRLSFLFEDSPNFIIPHTTIARDSDYISTERDITLNLHGHNSSNALYRLLSNLQSDGFTLSRYRQDRLLDFNARIGPFIIQRRQEVQDIGEERRVELIYLNTLNFHDNQNPEPAFGYASSRSPTISSTSYTVNPPSNIVKPKRKRKVKPKIEIQVLERNLNI